jgi:hypothetical protein
MRAIIKVYFIGMSSELGLTVFMWLRRRGEARPRSGSTLFPLRARRRRVAAGARGRWMDEGSVVLVSCNCHGVLSGCHILARWHRCIGHGVLPGSTPSPGQSSLCPAKPGGIVAYVRGSRQVATSSPNGIVALVTGSCQAATPSPGGMVPLVLPPC